MEETRIPARWQERHRGPYRLMVSRPGRKPGFYTTAWLAGEVESDDCDAEAAALLADPRDQILTVDVWSVKEGQFVQSYTNPRGTR